MSWRSAAITNTAEFCPTCDGVGHLGSVQNILNINHIASELIGVEIQAKRHLISLDLIRRGYNVEIFEDLDYITDDYHDGPNTPNWNVLSYSLNYIQLRYSYVILNRGLCLKVGVSGSLLRYYQGERSYLYREMYENAEVLTETRRGFNRHSNRIRKYDYGTCAEVSFLMDRPLRPFVFFYYGLSDVSGEDVITRLSANLLSLHVGLRYQFR